MMGYLTPSDCTHTGLPDIWNNYVQNILVAVKCKVVTPLNFTLVQNLINIHKVMHAQYKAAR